MSDIKEVTGGCLCGAIRFTARLPSIVCAHCHCSMCRRNHGAGAESARRLILGGMYPQLVHLDNWSAAAPGSDSPERAAARREQFKQQLTRVAGIHGALFNFSSMRPVADPEFPDRLQLEYWDFGAMPFDGRLAVLGFWNELAARWSPTRRGGLFVKVERAEHYLLRMTRDISAI